jgi:hypothetical protein
MPFRRSQRRLGITAVFHVAVSACRSSKVSVPPEADGPPSVHPSDASSSPASCRSGSPANSSIRAIRLSMVASRHPRMAGETARNSVLFGREFIVMTPPAGMRPAALLPVPVPVHIGGPERS